MKITKRLRDATAALYRTSSFEGVDPTRRQLVGDIKLRAQECSHMREGYEPIPHQLAYLQALRSRLQDFCLQDFDVVKEWLEAFSEAYQL